MERRFDVVKANAVGRYMFRDLLLLVEKRGWALMRGLMMIARLLMCSPQKLEWGNASREVS